MKGADAQAALESRLGSEEDSEVASEVQAAMHSIDNDEG